MLSNWVAVRNPRQLGIFEYSNNLEYFIIWKLFLFTKLFIHIFKFSNKNLNLHIEIEKFEVANP